VTKSSVQHIADRESSDNLTAGGGTPRRIGDPEVRR